jgi:hypothetical protein
LDPVASRLRPLSSSDRSTAALSERSQANRGSPPIHPHVSHRPSVTLILSYSMNTAKPPLDGCNRLARALCCEGAASPETIAGPIYARPSPSSAGGQGAAVDTAALPKAAWRYRPACLSHRYIVCTTAPWSCLFYMSERCVAPHGDGFRDCIGPQTGMDLSF